ncbi:hypothetical protein AV656_14085 [Bhargavaea cecembensis]|uniref:Uncharacterized protein n=1 Tax=Bhargavaea cecembensis TaxID=394098 RepID=A0A161SIG5_9BACL|nr:hypothetical protein [Bhargavaea cecembensis]KZE36903.1 hypothetical protein AV656_14085 [Bhargavaea cecembensis]
MSLRRKITAASLTGAAFAVLLGIVVPDPFGEFPAAPGGFWNAFTLSVPVYMMYSFPVILLFGVPASLLADFLSARLSRRLKKPTAEPVISGVLHAVFGLVALGSGMAAALIGFTADRLLRKRQEHSWSGALKSLGMPAFVWLFFMFIVYLKELPGDLPALLQTVNLYCN